MKPLRHSLRFACLLLLTPFVAPANDIDAIENAYGEGFYLPWDISLLEAEEKTGFHRMVLVGFGPIETASGADGKTSQVVADDEELKPIFGDEPRYLGADVWSISFNFSPPEEEEIWSYSVVFNKDQHATIRQHLIADFGEPLEEDTVEDTLFNRSSRIAIWRSPGIEVKFEIELDGNGASRFVTLEIAKRSPGDSARVPVQE